MQVIKTKKKLAAAAERKGIRAQNLMTAIGSIEEMQNQRPSFSKPTVLIENSEIIRECRTSAKDMALNECLLAIAKHSDITQPYHEVRASLLLDFLQIDSVDRLVESLVRLTLTNVYFDVRDVKQRRRYRQAVSLVNFRLENDIPDDHLAKELKKQIERGSAVLKFSIPTVVREVFTLPKPYTWVSLYAISRFRHKHSNALYQLLAVKAGHDDDFRKPLVIEPQVLAKKMGWSHAKATPFNAALFMKRCVEPALEDIRDCVPDFVVEMDAPKRDATKRGRPMLPLIFKVYPKPPHQLSGVELLAYKRKRVSRSTQEIITRPDAVHPPHHIPSVEAVTRAAQRLQERNWNGSKRIAQRNKRRVMTLALHWRTVLDALAVNPEVHVGWHIDGWEILTGLEDPRIGVDRVFEKWAGDPERRCNIRNMGVPVRTDIPRIQQERQLPSDLLLKPIHYTMVDNMMYQAGDLNADLSTHFQHLDYVWHAVAQAAPDGLNLGGLKKTMEIAATAHPVRQRMTAKTLGEAIFAHDFEKIERIMKAIFANKEKMKLHPRGKRAMPRPRRPVYGAGGWSFAPMTEAAVN